MLLILYNQLQFLIIAVYRKSCRSSFFILSPSKKSTPCCPDESQNYVSETSKQALRTLHPLFALKYSSTPSEKGSKKEINRELMNRVYNLTPVDAFKLNLVKKIGVLGVTGQNNMNDSQLSFTLMEEKTSYGLAVDRWSDHFEDLIDND